MVTVTIVDRKGKELIQLKAQLTDTILTLMKQFVAEGKGKVKIVSPSMDRVRFSQQVAGQKRSTQFADKTKTLKDMVGDVQSVTLTYKDLGP